MFLVIAYDIADDGRRARVARELEDWGYRTQFSVFECELDERQQATLIGRLQNLCSEGDALRVYKLCAACVGRCEIIGGKDLALDQDFYQV
jgi:CRISPR-associated protein Cas2